MPLSPASSRSAVGAGVSSLASTTLGSPASSLTVSNIPATANNLMVIVTNLASSAAALTDNVTLRFNGDSAASHYGAGPAASSVGGGTGGFNNAWIWTIGAATMNAPSGAFFIVHNYLNASALPITVEFFTGGRLALAGTSADFNQGAANGTWLGNAAITSMTLAPVTGPNLIAGCSMTVFGY